MSSERFARVQELFAAACTMPREGRLAFLERQCGADLQLRAEVEQLLAEDSDPVSALDSPIVTADLLLEKTGGELFPRTIGAYRVLRKLGEGGMGVVLEAEQTKPVVRRVALKIIKAGMDTKQVIARFEAERQALAMMDHPNIAKVFDAGATEASRPYFVMELVRGEPVTDYCDRERLSLEQRLHLFRDVCLAVQHAHQKGIIHRDIKPSNVLVTLADGEPLIKVIDFGIAKATAGRLTEKTLFTELHQLVGTPQYMSPEQAEASGMDIDTRSDIYALGVLLYELLAGTTPLDGGRLRSMSFAEIQRVIREEESPKPSTRLSAMQSERLSEPPTPSGGPLQERRLQGDIQPGARASGSDPSTASIADRRRSDPKTLLKQIRGDLDWIVMKCLEKDRSRRYQTTSALADDIARYLAHQPVLATPPSAGYRLRKFVRRNRGPVLAGLLIASMLLVAAGISIAFGLREARQRKEAEIARTRAEKAEGEAKARADELEQVATFQEEQFSDIDPQAMGLRIRDELLKKARAAAERSKLVPEEVDARIGELERLIAGSDFTGIAMASLDEDFFQPALAAIDKQFTDQPLVKGRLLQTLASTQKEVGLIEAAGKPQEQALEIRRRMLGDEHNDTLSSAIKSGLLFQAKGKPAEAEAVLRETLERCRRALGDEHPTTLDAMNTLGELLVDRGKHSEANALLREALDKFRRVLGEDHIDTIHTTSNLGTLMYTQAKWDQAEIYLRESVEKYRRVLGDEHPDTIMSLNNLAVLLQAQGQLAEAEPLVRETVEKFRRVCGDDHPDTLMALNNMGFLLFTMGKLTEAEPFYREALQRRRRVLSDDHPHTLNSMNNLAGLFKSQSKFSDAETYYREVLEKRRTILGDEHADTIASISNIGWLFDGQGKSAEAEPYYREALEKFRSVLGHEHPHTLSVTGNLANVLQLQGEPTEAIALLATDEPIARKFFTSQNVRLGRWLTALGRARAAIGEFDAALANLDEAQEILSKAVGATEQDRNKVITGFVELYDAWHAAEPDQGHDAKATEWRAKLAEWQASTQPALP